MKYQCSNSVCSMAAAVLPEASAIGMGMQCPVCKAKLVSVTEPEHSLAPICDAWTAKVISTYPILIAQPLAALAAKRDIEAQAKTLVDVFTNALKYLALVVETEYLYSPYQSDAVNRILDEDLERPLVSAWNKFLREALPFLSQAGHKPFIPELKPFYDGMEAGKPRIKIPGKGYYDDDGNFVATESKLNLIAALISYRNNFAHGLNQPEADARNDFEFYHDLLRQMLEGMAWCTRYPLLKREDGRWIRLMGDHPVESEPAPQDVSSEVTLVLGSPDPSRFLSLLPFLIVPRQFISDTAIGEDVLMYDQTTRKRILYVSPRGHQRETKGTLELWRKLIEDKRIRLPVLAPDALTADELAARCDRATREITQQKDNVFAGAYLSRPAPELELRVWPGTSYPLAALGAKAGAGKTCLLEHMAEIWSANGHEVLLVSCGRIEHRDLMSLLRDRLSLAETVDLRTLSGVLWNSGRRWVVVLDGLNEHPYREEFVASVLEAARELGAAGLRIVFSFRTEAMDWLKVSESDRRLFVVSTSTDKAGLFTSTTDAGMPHIPVGPLDMVERAAMWRLYSKHDPDKYKPEFAFNNMVSESRELAAFLSNPLLLRLFLQVYHNRAIPDRLSRSAFMIEYLHSIFKESGDKGSFLLELGRVFWERQAVRITVDELFDVPTLADAIRSADVNSPYRKLTSARLGILVEWREGDDRHVMFTAEAVMEALLGSVLGQTNPGPEQLAAMLIGNAAYPPARRAVTEALRQAVERGGTSVLVQFIQQNGADVAAVSGEVLSDLLLGGHEPAALAGELRTLTPPSSVAGLWRTAIVADDQLSDELAYRTIAVFTEALINQRGDDTNDDILLSRLLWRMGESLNELCEHSKALEYQLRMLALELNLLGEDHVVVARSLCGIGSTYLGLGDYAKALDHQLRALDVYRKSMGEEEHRVATLLSDIGISHVYLGQYAAALDCQLRALDVSRKLLGEENPHFATILSNVGSTYGFLGRHVKALECHLYTLELRRKVLGEEHPDIAASFHKLGDTYGWLGDYGKRREYHLRALDLRRRVLGNEHPKVADSLASVAGTYDDCGDYRKALEYELLALELRRKALGEEHPDVAESLNGVGGAYGDLGNHAQALEYKLRALELRRKTFGEEHPDVATSLNSVGRTYGDLDDAPKALEYKLQALKLRRKTFGEEHSITAQSLCDVGGAYGSLSNFPKALECVLSALELNRKLLGDDHPFIATNLNNVGHMYYEMGNFAKALEYELRGLALYRKVLGEKHPDVAMGMDNVGCTYSAMGDQAKSLEYQLRGLELRQEVLGEEHTDVVTSLSHVGSTYGELCDHKKALEYQIRELRCRRKVSGDECVDVATSLNNIAISYRQLGQYVEAIEYHAHAFEMRRKLLGESHEHIANSFSSFGNTYGRMGDHQKALEYKQKALELRRKLHGGDHPDVAKNLASVGETYAALGDGEQAEEHKRQAQEMTERLNQRASNA